MENQKKHKKLKYREMKSKVQEMITIEELTALAALNARLLEKEYRNKRREYKQKYKQR